MFSYRADRLRVDVTTKPKSQCSRHGKWVNMARTREKGQTDNRRGQRSLAKVLRSCSLMLCPLYLALTGCNAITTSAPAPRAGDPLLGDYLPPGQSAPPPPPTKAKSVGVPPIPTGLSGTTPAALASIPGSRGLAINENQANASWAAPGGQAPSAQLRRPEPVVQAVPRDTGFSSPPPPPNLAVPPPSPGSPPSSVPGPTVNAAPWAGAGQAVSPENLQAQLQARGVLWQKQDQIAEGVRFSAMVPNPSNPQITRVYEATGPDYATAVQAVLRQIEGAR